MEKTINIGGRLVAFRATAAVPRLYRIKFHRDVFADMRKIAKQVEAERERKKTEEDMASALSPELLFLFEDLAYMMAKHANPQGVPGSVEKWLDEFECFNIYEVLPELIELWNLNNLQTSKPVKK